MRECLLLAADSPAYVQLKTKVYSYIQLTHLIIYLFALYIGSILLLRTFQLKSVYILNIFIHETKLNLQ